MNRMLLKCYSFVSTLLLSQALVQVKVQPLSHRIPKLNTSPQKEEKEGLTLKEHGPPTTTKGFQPTKTYRRRVAKYIPF